MTDQTQVVTAPETRAARWRVLAVQAAIWTVVHAREYRVHLALPGLLGGAMVACGIGGLVGAAFGPGFGPWAGVLAGGVFLLRVDNRVGGG